MTTNSENDICLLVVMFVDTKISSYWLNECRTFPTRLIPSGNSASHNCPLDTFPFPLAVRRTFPHSSRTCASEDLCFIADICLAVFSYLTWCFRDIILMYYVKKNTIKDTNHTTKSLLLITIKNQMRKFAKHHILHGLYSSQNQTMKPVQQTDYRSGLGVTILLHGILRIIHDTSTTKCNSILSTPSVIT